MTTQKTDRSKIEERARKAETKARAADFTAAVDDAMREHITLNGDTAIGAVLNRAVIADVAAKRVALVLARSWHDVSEHQSQTAAEYGADMDRVARAVAAAVDRRVLDRARKAWDKIASTLQYVSVREKADSHGNTYHSVQIVYIDGTVQRIGETYGYGNHWQTTVAQALAHSIEGAALPSVDAISEGYSAVGRRVARDNAHHDVVTIARTKDHYDACDRG